MNATSSSNPFVILVAEALNLMHPRFATGRGNAYLPGEAPSGKWREKPFLLELYHQLRHLWDRAVPVQLGLGHLVIQGEPSPADAPDLLFWQLGEGGQPDRRLGAVSLVFLTHPEAVDTDLFRLRWFQREPGYPHAVCVLVGRKADIPASGLPEAAGVTTLFFDTDRWQAVTA